MVTFDELGNLSPSETARLILCKYVDFCGSVRQTSEQFGVSQQVVWKSMNDAQFIIPALTVRYIIAHYLFHIRKKTPNQ